jgi:hypothetical protein
MVLKQTNLLRPVSFVFICYDHLEMRWRGVDVSELQLMVTFIYQINLLTYLCIFCLLPIGAQISLNRIEEAENVKLSISYSRVSFWSRRFDISKSSF